MYFSQYTLNGARIALVGEDHFTDVDKRTVARLIQQEARKRNVRLFVESIVENAWDQDHKDMMQFLGVEPTDKPSPASAEKSLLFMLQTVAETFPADPATYFEYPVLNPEALAEAVSVTRKCLFAASGWDSKMRNAISNLVVPTLAAVVTTTRSLVRRGLADERTLPIVRDQVYAMASTYFGALRRAGASATMDALRPGDDNYVDAATDAFFAPHLASDAVLATTLHRMAAPGTTMIVVCGAAHWNAIGLLLRGLGASAENEQG